MQARAPLAAVIAPHLHGHCQLLGPAEGRDEKRHQQGITDFARFISPPSSKEAPRADCAFIMRSASSIRVGINRSAMVIIMATSWAGKCSFLQTGESSLSMPSVSAMGAVVRVKKRGAGYKHYKAQSHKHRAHQPFTG